MSVVSTSIKIPEELKARIQRLAELSRRSPHSVMVEALEREVAREERLYEFVQEALQSDKDVEEGGNVYRADDVHAWLKRLAQGETTARPQPWQK
ncbi:MAG: ribbon-helix-helix domain-containing protein [Pseudomonadota bacterium]